MDAAERLLSARGIFGVSLREVRRAAGARNTNAIQFHFRDREGILEALAQRHIPRIALLQRQLHDALIGDDPAIDRRALVEVLVRPSADYLTLGASERAWVKIMAELGALPDLRVRDIVSIAPPTAVRTGRDLYERLVEAMPPDIAVERLFILGQSTVHLCADRARQLDDIETSRGYVPHSVFVTNLVDMCCAAMFAPVTPVVDVDLAAQLAPSHEHRAQSDLNRD